MTNETTAKMLERVRALLAKAEGTTFPEEADTFRAKADELMTRYAIDQWMVEQAEQGVNASRTPERRDFDIPGRHSKFRWDLSVMFSALARHCRCVVGTRGQDYSTGKVPVYGLASDLDYLDVMFTSLSVEVAKNLQPSVDAAGEVGHEVFKQRQAGIGWAEITRKMYQAGLIAPTKANRTKYRLPEGALEWETLKRVTEPTWGTPEGEMNAPYYWGEELGQLATELKNRLANANRRYVKEHGLEGQRNYVKPEVYQRSFMYGFSQEINRRIRDMTARTYDAAADSNSMALAVRDIREQALAVYNAEFPPPPPVPVDPNYKPPKGRAIKVREVTIDRGAYHAGAAKARTADLGSNPSRRVPNRKGLDR